MRRGFRLLPRLKRVPTHYRLVVKPEGPLIIRLQRNGFLVSFNSLIQKTHPLINLSPGAIAGRVPRIQLHDLVVIIKGLP